MEFKDFKDSPQDLIGKYVLYERGLSYHEKKSLSILKIDKVTKTGFRLFSMPDELFSLIDGCQKGLNGRMDIATISRCKLITEDEALQLKQQWAHNKKERALREKMKAKLESMTYEQLLKMELL